jgi:hypothetical protein
MPTGKKMVRRSRPSELPAAALKKDEAERSHEEYEK